MKPRRVIVLGKLVSIPYAGTAWMYTHITLGRRRPGRDVYYFKTTSAWRYNPLQRAGVRHLAYVLPDLSRAANRFGPAPHGAYGRSYSVKEWFGLQRGLAEEFPSSADTVFNVGGSPN